MGIIKLKLSMFSDDLMDRGTPVLRRVVLPVCLNVMTHLTIEFNSCKENILRIKYLLLFYFTALKIISLIFKQDRGYEMLLYIDFSTYRKPNKLGIFLNPWQIFWFKTSLYVY